jgi:hypothetical protein
LARRKKDLRGSSRKLMPKRRSCVGPGGVAGRWDGTGDEDLKSESTEPSMATAKRDGDVERCVGAAGEGDEEMRMKIVATKGTSSGKKSVRRPVVKKALGPGLHAGTVELQSEGSYRVQLVGGGHVRARVDDALPAEFVGECMKRGHKVVLQDGADGPVILGALWAPTKWKGEDAELSGRMVRLEATEGLSIKVGDARLEMDKKGAIRLKGKKMVIDIAQVVRFLSSRVELP